MWLARYSAAASILSNRSRLVPGAGSPDRYRGATRSSQDRLYTAPTVSLTFSIADHQEPPALHVSAARRAHAGFEDLPDQVIWHRVRFEPPHRTCGFDDLEQIRAFIRHDVLAIGSAEVVR